MAQRERPKQQKTPAKPLVTTPPRTLDHLGWSAYFGDQVADDEGELTPARVDGVHRGRLTALTGTGQLKIVLPARTDTGTFAVGDWVLADPVTRLLHRRLERNSLLQRPSEGNRPTQLVAANIDTLFIVASCNADFNIARLERYLALANDAGTEPVIVLTKIDTAENVDDFERQAGLLQRRVPVIALNARSPDAIVALRPWCGTGKTVALVGSSGVGKSTLVNALIGSEAKQQLTGSVGKSDARGNHVTTSRSLHAMAGGGWVIDTPGMRSVHVRDATQGIDTLFEEITELAPACKFRDCTHDHEPGCAVLAAVAGGNVDAARLERWRKLQAENQTVTRR
jgi:ribosome biogenesis GTPase / thiamine phosphate phosphatase